MASGDIPTVSEQVDGVRSRPQIGLFSMIRLGLFNTGIAMKSLLTLGVLNRVTIAAVTFGWELRAWG